jgi:hypothetical protein
VLLPGVSIQVDEDSLKTAHKVLKDVEQKLLYIGVEPPSYLTKGAKASLKKGVASRVKRRASSGRPPSAQQQAPISASAAAPAEASTSEPEQTQEAIEGEGESRAQEESGGKKGRKRW